MTKTQSNSMTLGNTEVIMWEDLENVLQSTADVQSQLLRTDAGNASIFAWLYGEDIRYCYLLSKWLVWDGKRWVIDDTGEIQRKAKKATNRLWRAVEKFSDQDLRDAWKKHILRS